MMRYLLTADIHGNEAWQKKVLHSAQRNGFERWIDLGDVGTDACYDLLRTQNAQLAFGNYEVSQWMGLSETNRQWVRRRAPLISGPNFLAAHASPQLLATLGDIEQAWDYMVEHNLSWRDLFPRLDRNEDARWHAYAKLETRGKQILFHGHTHIQVAWRIGTSGAMTRIEQKQIHIVRGYHYIVGVGSVGKPESASRSQYAIYDEKQNIIDLCTIA
jgi:predicted phosphodiesterase